MNKHLWRFGAAALSLSLVLAGCGSGSGKQGDSAGGSGTAQTLRVWFPGNLSNEITWVNDTLVPAFEKKHPNVDVKVEFVDWGDLSTRLSVAFAGNTAPDVFGHGNASAAGFAAAGRVEPLDSYVAKLPAKDREDLVFLADGQVDGKQYIMPLRGFGYLLAYREDMFKSAGLDASQPPANWQELTDAAKKLTVREGDRITRAGVVMPADDPTSMSQAFGTFLFQAGGSFLSKDGTKITWNDQAGVDSLTYLAGLYKGTGAVATGLNEATSGSGAQHPLATGRAAMALLDDATLKTIYEQAPAVAKNIRVAPPLSNLAQASFGGAGNGMFISSSSEIKPAAWDFISFMLEPANLKQYTLTVGGIPARGTLTKDAELVKVPYLVPFMDSAELFQGNPNVPNWTKLRDVLSKQIERALHGATDPRTALDTAATEGAALLTTKP